MADALANEPLALEVKKLTKVFGDRKALDNVSFSLPQGAFLSIFGPNGAGKTTMLRMLSTLARPTSGTIRVMGIDAKEDPDKVRDHIGLISHNSMLYPDLTAMENMMFVARLYGVVDPEARVRELLRAVELEDPGISIGRDSSEAIQIGVVCGEAARVDGLVDRIHEQLGYTTKVVATGGLAHRIAPLSRTITEIDVELTLQGLRLIYNDLKK